MDPPSIAKLDAAQPRYRPVPSSNLQPHTQTHTVSTAGSHTRTVEEGRDRPDSPVKRVVEIVDDPGGVPGDCDESEDT